MTNPGHEDAPVTIPALLAERFSSTWWATRMPEHEDPDSPMQQGIRRQQLRDTVTIEPCPVCGAEGACAYDTEGRALIHTDTQLPEDEVPA